MLDAKAFSLLGLSEHKLTRTVSDVRVHEESDDLQLPSRSFRCESSAVDYHT
jgi:hypothetical protein